MRYSVSSQTITKPTNYAVKIDKQACEVVVKTINLWLRPNLIHVYTHSMIHTLKLGTIMQTSHSYRASQPKL